MAVLERKEKKEKKKKRRLAYATPVVVVVVVVANGWSLVPLKQAAWRSTERTGGSKNRASVAAKQPTRKGEGMCDQKKKKLSPREQQQRGQVNRGAGIGNSSVNPTLWCGGSDGSVLSL